MSFSWDGPVLSNNIQLTSYIMSYNVTDAFNEQFNDSILISGEHHNYVFNGTCGYETGVALCPASHYCFTLRGIYINDRTTIETTPADKICFTTSQYRKYIVKMLNCYSKICIALYVSFKNTDYNVTEGTKLNITVVSSRAYSTDFYVHVNSSLITATGKYR